MKRTIALLACVTLFAACKSSSEPNAPNTFTGKFSPMDNSTLEIPWTATTITATSRSVAASNGSRSILFSWAKDVVAGNFLDTGSVPPVTCTFTDSTGTYVHPTTGTEQYKTGCNIVVQSASGSSYSGTFTFLARSTPSGGRSSGWSGTFSVSH